MTDGPDPAPAPGIGPKPAKAPPRSARRRARELAVQALYQWLVSREDAGAVEAHLSESPGFEKADRDHFRALLHGVIRDVDALHEAITPFLDRRVDELSPVEHAVHVLEAVGAAEGLGEFHRLVDDDAVGDLRMMRELVRPDQQRRVLDRVAGRLRPAEAPQRAAR